MISEILSFVGLITALITALVIFRQFKQAQAMIPSFDDLFEEGEDGQLLVDERLSKVIDAFGSRMAKSLKMSFLQGLGAEAKISKGLKGAVAQDIVDNKFPLFNLIGDAMGFNTKQYVAKHPEAIGQLLGLIAPALGKIQLPGQQTANQANPIWNRRKL